MGGYPVLTPAGYPLSGFGTIRNNSNTHTHTHTHTPASPLLVLVVLLLRRASTPLARRRLLILLLRRQRFLGGVFFLGGVCVTIRTVYQYECNVYVGGSYNSLGFNSETCGLGWTRGNSRITV